MSPFGKLTGSTYPRVLTLVGLLLFCYFSTPTASGQYRFDVLSTDTGLPQSTVYSILQTRDGYMWFTTLDGLVRYDGARYTVFNKANTRGILSNRFRCLYEDVDGTLWIGTEDGGLTHYANGKFRTYGLEDGLPNALIGKVRRSAEGTLLVLSGSGLARMRNDKFEVLSRDPNSFACEIGIEGRSGDSWYRVGSELRRVGEGKTINYRVPDGGPSTFMNNQIYEDRQGRLWIGSKQKGELWMLKDEAMTRYSVRDGLPLAIVLAFYEDWQGAMWFGTEGGGLIRFKDGKFITYTVADGLSSNSIISIFEDREGTLWVGTMDNGVMQVSRRVITTYSEKDGLKGKIFYPIIEDREGSVWVGHEGVNRFKGGKFTYYPLNFAPEYVRQRIPYAVVQSFLEDREGRLWIGHGVGFYRFEAEQFTYDTKVTRGGPFVIYQDSQGVFWFGYDSALIRHKDGEIKQFTESDGLYGYVQPVYEDRKGRIWIGTYGGLAQYVDGRLVFLTENDGLSSNRVRAIYEDSDGVLWIGTYDGGLNRFKDGRFTSFTMEQGMFSNGVFAILEDNRGNFWMSSNQGIYRVARQQLNDFAEGRAAKINCVSYGKSDGMLSTECNGARHPSAIKTRDGRMWFPTFNGIAVVDPEVVSFNPVPPPVIIESAMLDRKEVSTEVPIEISPGQSNLEIRYTALSFIKPEHLQFKYRLEGADADWVDAGNRRVAYYTHLPPGEYVFRVMAANSDGVWNEEGTQIIVSVIPPFWQRWWFLALATVSVAAITLIVFHTRIRTLERAQAAREAFSCQLISSQEAERKRIASGLHDSLGQQLLVIKNWAMIELNAGKEDSPSREALGEISSTASQAIEEVREIIYDLRPYQLDKIGLASTIKFMIEKVSASSSVKFDVKIGEIDHLLSHDSEITFYRIVQECVNNIVKHAQATSARVQIDPNESVIELTVEDDGCGFSPDVVGSSDNNRDGLGLSGMSERVRILDGKLTIKSSPGAGTKVFITVNAGGKNEV